METRYRSANEDGLLSLNQYSIENGFIHSGPIVLKASECNLKLLADFSRSTSITKKVDLKKLKKGDHFLGHFLLNFLDYMQLGMPALLLEVLSTTFPGFHTIQLFSHEKGQSKALSFTTNLYKNEEQSSISTSTFELAFTQIKKSRSKLFTQKTFQVSEIALLGPFLAKEFSYSSHRYIFFVSRDDMFPPTDDETKFFNKCTPTIGDLCHLLFLNTRKVELKKIRENLFSKQDHQALSPPSLSTSLHHDQRIALLGELLNTLRHELSNPLQGIKMAASLLKEDEEGLPEEFIKDIVSSAIRSETILENFSSLYLKSDERTEFSLKKILTESLLLTKSETRDIEKKLIISADLENQLLFGNPTWISQIIFNLVINAAQAIRSAQKTKNSLITIEAKRKSKETILLSVTNNGPLIPMEIAMKIFDPFYTTKLSGTGLGLSICRNLSERLESNLMLDTNYKDGVRFLLELRG